MSDQNQNGAQSGILRSIVAAVSLPRESVCREATVPSWRISVLHPFSDVLRANDRLTPEAQRASAAVQTAFTLERANAEGMEFSDLHFSGDQRYPARCHGGKRYASGIAGEDLDTDADAACSFRKRKVILPASGRYILKTRRKCNLLAFVQHFELPRYDTLEPLNVQQNCQLHTVRSSPTGSCLNLCRRAFTLSCRPQG